ncbi:hypothetical protein DL98DRAFT_627904 [Cadophora sp. DSE1049]|nr:hypothetical protein DL98DRAFT_627904 [Cadophora sp. DSE1049]
MEAKLKVLLDKEEIRDISKRYNRYADAADGDKFASLWVEDGIFEIVGNKTYIGPEEIAFACRAATQVVHFAADSEITVDGDTADQTSKLILFFRHPDGQSMRFACTTTLTDKFVRKEGKWFIKHRRSHTDLPWAEAVKTLGIGA